MPDDQLLNESPDQKLDAEIMSIIEETADCDKQSGFLNTKRAKLRDRADKIGYSSHALQELVYQLKKQTKAERIADQRAIKRGLEVADGRQKELWPDEVEAQDKRMARKQKAQEKAKAAAAKKKAESIERGDDMPRSDPKRGGAGKGKKKPLTDEQAFSSQQAEQTEGGVTLDGLLPSTKAAQAAAKSE